MNRVPEPELMVDADQALAYASADFAEPHDHFIALLGERLPGLPRIGHAVDLGCGPGDVTRRFARAYPAWSVDAVDGSPAMLELANRDTAESELRGRITYHEVRLPSDSWQPVPSALVFSNSLLHHLDDPAALWSTATRCAAPGARIFVMDLMRPETRDEATAFVERYARNEPEVLRRDFFNSLLAAYRIEEVEFQLALAELDALHVEAVSDRHLVVWGRVD